MRSARVAAAASALALLTLCGLASLRRDGPRAGLGPARWAREDLELGYVLTPGRYGPLPKMSLAAVRINSRGGRGPEPRAPSALCLGDSCTFGVGVGEDQSFPALLSRMGVEAFNAGVPGYDSFQGRLWLNRVPRFQPAPRLVTLYFGWNDHWCMPGSQKAWYRLRRAAARVGLGWRVLRLQQRLMSWKSLPRAQAVALPDFKANLRAMVEDCRRRGAYPLLVTPPWEPRLAVPEESFFLEHPRAELDRHPAYVQAVRETAAETGAGLLDLAREFEALASPDPTRYFFDFAHLNAEGHRHVAKRLAPWMRCARAGTCPPRPG